jgi:hypothetical protein
MRTAITILVIIVIISSFFSCAPALSTARDACTYANQVCYYANLICALIPDTTANRATLHIYADSLRATAQVLLSAIPAP